MMKSFSQLAEEVSDWFHWFPSMVRKEDTKKKKKKKRKTKNKKKHDGRISSGSKFWPGSLVSSSSYVCECFCSRFWSYKYVYHPPPANEARGKHTTTEPHFPHSHTSLLFLWASFSWRCIHLPTLGDIWGEKLENRRLEPLLNAVIVSSIRTHTCTPFLPQLARAGTHKQFCHGTNVHRETTIFNNKAIQQVTFFPPL